LLVHLTRVSIVTNNCDVGWCCCFLLSFGVVILLLSLALSLADSHVREHTDCRRDTTADVLVWHGLVISTLVVLVPEQTKTKHERMSQEAANDRHSFASSYATE